MSIFNTVGRDVSDLSVSETLQTANLDWTVTKQPIFTDSPDNGEYITTNKHFATVRDDTKTILGIVGPDYQVVQNMELAYLCERVAANNQVQIETAGSLNGGQRVWIQMKGNSFDVGSKRDENYATTLFTNGHDGQWPLSSLPTSVRVICQNTLNMALQSGKRQNMIISMRHVGDMQSRLEEMINAIEQFEVRADIFATKAKALGGVEINTEFVQKFWTQLYMDQFGDIHNDPDTEQTKADNDHAKSVMTKWANTFDAEVKHSGANLWTAMNAVTYWLDHQQIYRGTNKAENRFNDTLFGNGAKEKVNVFNYAMSYV